MVGHGDLLDQVYGCHLRGGDSKLPPSIAYDQRMHHGQAQRHLEGDERAASVAAADRDGAAHARAGFAHDLHAHAAPAELRHRICRAEAGAEDQIHLLTRRERVRLPIADDAAGDRLGGDPLGVDPSPVVAHRDDRLFALDRGLDIDRAVARLSLGLALVR